MFLYLYFSNSLLKMYKGSCILLITCTALLFVFDVKLVGLGQSKLSSGLCDGQCML